MAAFFDPETFVLMSKIERECNMYSGCNSCATGKKVAYFDVLGQLLTFIVIFWQLYWTTFGIYCHFLWFFWQFMALDVHNVQFCQFLSSFVFGRLRTSLDVFGRLWTSLDVFGRP